MKIAVLHAYPVEPDGLSIQGNLLYRGLKEIGVDVMPCHYVPNFQKQWLFDAYKPDIAIGVGCWTYTPDIIYSPQNHGVIPVPWFVADGWVANYHDVIGKLPLVLTTSNWVTDTYKRDGVNVNNFRTLPIGFDADEMRPILKSDPKIIKLREMLGIQPHEKMILTVGGDVTSKGAQEMFHALAEVDKTFKDWKYVLKHWDCESAEVHGKEEDVLIDQLGLDRGKIQFLSGAFSHDFMAYLLSAADIYAAPSRLEGFGMIQMEAEACGVPVISINVGGPVDTIVHGKTGYLASIGSTVALTEEWAYESMGFEADHKVKFDEPKVFAYRADIAELAKYTLELLTNDKLREEMGQNGRAHAMANFQYKDVAQKAMKFIEENIKL
ncbi:MAG: Glycosyl transferase group 1 [Candidatus Falkowbacteria bacterium GW2011_GWC2_38_22]|uniref:Glycosyl transferase group 1 n=1 Tax=Candidatus Falkowbacteria bacterium GW2011_GWE1_38_31 TaxID=1618638 RepID=A0A0G0JUF1_9BACT|nr:MAG: Glycosyl transferase group 1 [Candidatus Falkowbacteria bacterium GW2011_GWF2_38_1205]KKQ61394.1 MAG: Glycosyl transferase group 1 [Candidatus Falkowbacteria bacterium GW2011_GWC2_38_22]KKQ64023.1 MAG: Glycosyl transferase group 1 [Candidatus Falkowbacteria bacterium GW2011_GWF1_38_22]KKQ66629.1 MAG: Glycosyl transferase group 1 [Candidatus Falkowbacteria bacterium GW2011_GWE2_38_254]KKQ71128.1 MAG: Glycosyl transferase group 1 [Candidatus Falkowbacteria bacterium GW2011_GWE1_38_31]KKQ